MDSYSIALVITLGTVAVGAATAYVYGPATVISNIVDKGIDLKYTLWSHEPLKRKVNSYQPKNINKLADKFFVGTLGKFKVWWPDTQPEFTDNDWLDNEGEYADLTINNITGQSLEETTKELVLDQLKMLAGPDGDFSPCGVPPLKLLNLLLPTNVEIEHGTKIYIGSDTCLDELIVA